MRKVQIYPSENGTCNLIVIYEIGEPEQRSLNGHYLSIDLGLHTLMTCYDSGNEKLYRKKQNAGKDYLHKVTRWLAEYCKKEEISCVVIGDIRNIRKEKDMGHKTNQCSRSV